MKFKLLCLTAALTLTALTSTPVVANDQLAQSICSYVAADNRNALRKTLSDNRLRLSNIYSGISCDGLNMVRFAMTRGANDTADFIIKQLPGSVVAASGDIDWAQSNGFGSSPVVEALQARAGG